jgi:hypothetical protein
MALDDLKSTLHNRAGYQVVEGSSSENQIRLVGRVPPNAMSYWVLIVHRLLVVSGQSPWKVDISKTYFLREMKSGKKLFYAWRLIFQATGVMEHVPHIVETINNTPRPSKVELTEFPLTGYSPNRNRLVNGKGAGSVDRMPLGPMAAMHAMAGRMNEG